MVTVCFREMCIRSRLWGWDQRHFVWGCLLWCVQPWRGLTLSCSLLRTRGAPMLWQNVSSPYWEWRCGMVGGQAEAGNVVSGTVVQWTWTGRTLSKENGVWTLCGYDVPWDYYYPHRTKAGLPYVLVLMDKTKGWSDKVDNDEGSIIIIGKFAACLRIFTRRWKTIGFQLSARTKEEKIMCGSLNSMSCCNKKKSPCNWRKREPRWTK